MSTGEHQPDIYEALRVASPRKRNRQWEKQHLSRKAVYRGVDPKLAMQVKSIAASLFVPEGEVACFLLSHALQAYATGDLNLNPRPNPCRMRMTLFPQADGRNGPKSEVCPARSKKAVALWRVIVTWRCFSPELKGELAALASEDGLNVPLGELVSALLRFGLKMYEMGVLKLEPVHKTGTLTLAGEEP
jgi:hypothetical protein